jgi:hypothetical protein
VTGAAVPVFPEMKLTWAVFAGELRGQPTESRPSMHSQVRFVMHPDDEREFEQLLLAKESIRFIEGPRWKTETPLTSRSLADIHDNYCIIWSPNDIAKLKAEYIPTCNDWYCRSEYATIHFWRSEIDGLVITEGHISVSTRRTADFPASSAKNVEKRYVKLRSHIKKTFSNSMLQWRSSEPVEPGGRERSANPSKPDPNVWFGPHALRWLRERSDRRVKQFLQMRVEAVLVPAEV